MINLMLIILLAIYGIRGEDARTFITKPGEFNYFVMVWYNDEFHCGGIIIDQRHIVTRGSCVVGIPSSSLSIIAGTIKTRVSEAQPLQVESVHIHYGFKTIDLVLGQIHWLHDIAILKLVNRMVWDSLTAPAVITTVEYNLDSELQCVVPGWKHSCVRSMRENYYIRWVKGSPFPDDKCIELGIRLLKNERCAFWGTLRYEWGVGWTNSNCQYYHGGSPIICGNAVVGIVDGRNRGRFHAFLNLLPYRDFIENAIDDTKRDVNPGEIDYVVSVWYDYRFKCGGIILDASYILTTADCVRYAKHTRLKVIAGRTQVLVNDPQIQWLSIDNIEIHPEYEEILHIDGPKFMHVKNNYAVLKLAVPLEWGPTISPASLSNTHFVPTNLACGAYRWHNAYNVDDNGLLQLIWSQEVILSAEICQKAGIDLEADEICVSSQYAQHPRNLDSSGNPIVCEGSVIGIIIPDFSTVPRLSCLTSVLNISPFVNALGGRCYSAPIH